MAPTADQIRLAREAMEEDAKKWRAAADVMGEAARNAASYTLSGFHFGHLPDQAGVTGKYAELQSLIQRLLQEGENAMRELDRALIAALDAYDRADERASGRINSSGGELHDGSGGTINNGNGGTISDGGGGTIHDNGGGGAIHDNRGGR
jgi:hypothetical protein